MHRSIRKWLPVMALLCCLPTVSKAAAVAVASQPTDVGIYRTYTAYPATDAGIRAAVARAQAAGGGIVLLPDATITLTSALPLVNGVIYRGVPARQTFSGDVPDSSINPTGGTILQGDGTFNGFDQGQVDAGSPTSPFAVGAPSNCGIEDVALNNFSTGIKIGAQNKIGVQFSRFRNIYITNAANWGLNAENFMHTEFSRIWVKGSLNGMRFAASGNLLFPGNSRLDQLFIITSGNLLQRGYVFEGNGSTLNEMYCTRLQCNRFGGVAIAQTATFTSGNSTIAVTDGTKFAVGMPVAFTANIAGFAASQMVAILSVAGNNITVGDLKSGSADVPNASTTGTIKSFGFPNLEINGFTGGVNSSQFLGLDLEGNASCSVWDENSSKLQFTFDELNTTAPYSNFIGRNARANIITSNDTGFVTDMDANSGTTAYVFGSRGAIKQSAGMGHYLDGTVNAGVLNIRHTDTNNKGDLEIRGNSHMMYPNQSAMGQTVNSSNATSLTLTSTSTEGLYLFSGTSAATWVLPTVTNATNPTSLVGVPYWFVNSGTANLTITTDGTQLFNRVSAKTSYVLTPGQTLQCWGALDASGNLFWAAFPSNGVS